VLGLKTRVLGLVTALVRHAVRDWLRTSGLGRETGEGSGRSVRVRGCDVEV